MTGTGAAGVIMGREEPAFEGVEAGVYTTLGTMVVNRLVAELGIIVLTTAMEVVEAAAELGTTVEPAIETGGETGVKTTLGTKVVKRLVAELGTMVLTMVMEVVATADELGAIVESAIEGETGDGGEGNIVLAAVGVAGIGAIHFVQTVEVEVLSTVEIVLVTCLLGFPMVGVIIVVKGQVVKVV